MDLAKGIVKAYQTKWSYINSFRVQITFLNEKMRSAIGWRNDVEGRDINLNIVSVDTPQFTNQGISEFVGNRWKIHNGRDEMYIFTITFRDQDQLKYYNKFLTAYHLQKTNYFDTVKMEIAVFKDPDYAGEKEVKLFDFEGTMIDSISQLQFSNTTETQIAEFSVTFKTTSPLTTPKALN